MGSKSEKPLILLSKNLKPPAVVMAVNAMLKKLVAAQLSSWELD